MKRSTVSKLSVVMVLVAGLVTGCGKPNVKNETNKYNNYQKNLKTLAGKYPAFHNIMVTVSKKAQTEVMKSKNFKDEAKKAEAIAAANDVFTDSKFYTQLSSYDGRRENILEMKRYLSRVVSKKHRKTIDSAISKADEALKEAGTKMNNAKPANEEDAYKVVKEANGILIGASSKLNSAKKRVKGKTKSPFKKKSKKN